MLTFRLATLLVAAVGACDRVHAPAHRPVRVVSLHDVTTEIVVALGAVDLLVAVAGPVDQPPDVVAAIASIPRADGVESVLAAEPSVLLGMAIVGQRSPDLVRLLRARGADVLLGDPQTLDDVFALVTSVAARVGRRDDGARLVARLRDGLPASALEASGGEVAPKEPVRVFVYDCCDPAFTAGRRAVLTDLLRHAGGRNVFDDVETAWTKVPWETVVARRPHLIVINDYNLSGQSDVRGKRAQLAEIASLASLPTLVMPLGEALGGVRSVAGLRRLSREIAAVAHRRRSFAASGEGARP